MIYKITWYKAKKTTGKTCLIATSNEVVIESQNSTMEWSIGECISTVLNWCENKRITIQLIGEKTKL